HRWLCDFGWQVLPASFAGLLVARVLPQLTFASFFPVFALCCSFSFV
ncbi:MAG: hypothetical protein RJB60_951, partial [Pseudomonadota bacterium]